MKFIIDSNAYEIAKNQRSQDVIALVSRTVNRNLFLKKEAGRLLQTADCEIDFEEWSEGFDREEVRDLKDGLTLLECFGIARCWESDRDVVRTVRAAGERDYRHIAAFIREQQGDTFGFLPSASEDFYSEDNIRARQFMNVEYCFLAEKDGRIESLIIIAMPKPQTLSSAVRICGMRFRTDLEAQRREYLLEQMINRAADSFSDDYTKLRYLRWKDSQDDLTDSLERLGFVQICTLKKEAYDGSDVTVYDLQIGNKITEME